MTRGYSLRSAGHVSGESDDAGPALASAAPEKRRDDSGDSSASAGVEEKEKTARTASTSGSGVDVAADAASSKQTPEQMVNVNRFLRREKEIAETRVEILQAEVSRLKQHNEYVEKQMAQANKTLAAERQRATVRGTG